MLRVGHRLGVRYYTRYISKLFNKKKGYCTDISKGTSEVTSSKIIQIDSKRLKDKIISLKDVYLEHLKFGFSNGFNVYSEIQIPKYFNIMLYTTCLGSSLTVFSYQFYTSYKDCRDYYRSSDCKLGNIILCSGLVGIGGGLVGVIIAPFYTAVLPSFFMYLLLNKIKIKPQTKRRN